MSKKTVIISRSPRAISSPVVYVTMEGERIPFGKVAGEFISRKNQSKENEKWLAIARDSILSEMGDSNSLISPEFLATRDSRENVRYIGIPADVQAEIDRLLSPFKTIVKIDTLKVSAR